MSINKEREEPAILAYNSFEKGDYKTSLQHISEMESIIGSNNKRLQHNKALIQFMQSDMKKSEKFLNTLCQLSGLNFPDVDVKEVDSHCILFNYCVLLFHSRYYYQCSTLLERLMSTVNTSSENKIAQHIVLLWLEATLCRRTAEKALEIAMTHGDLFSSNSNTKHIFDRLVCRANLMLTHKLEPALEPDTVENLFLIAHHHYLKGDAKEAASTLDKHRTLKFVYDLKNQGEDIWAAINNNLGVIYLSLKKPFLATKYFQHAVKEHFRTVDSEDSERLIICRERPLYVHNLGVALLAANIPEGAFECLVEAARHYPNNPEIWLNLAECCVKKCCSESAMQYTAKKLGSGSHTRILLSRDHKEKYSSSGASSGESFAIPSLSLEFAALCLRNALTLLPDEETPTDIHKPMIQAPPGPPITWHQRCYLKNSSLILQSYVLLQLQDPLASVTSVNELLSQPDVSNCHKALAHVYAAEALIVLDRITDAVEHLHPPTIHEIASALTPQMRDMIGVSVWAKAAVCHILRGDLVTARKILVQINSPDVLPLQMYLEMCTGNIDNCHLILKKLRCKN